MLFCYNLDFFNDQIYEELQKRWRKVSGNQRSSKARKFIGLRKFRSQNSSPTKRGFPRETISQPKGPYCEIEVLLRNKPPSAKSFRSPKTTLYENFRSCKTLLRHTCAISQLLNGLQNPLKPHFAAQALSTKSIRSCESLLRHTCAISQLQNGLRNPLRNRPLAAKSPSCCEMSLLLQKSQPSLKS